MSTTNRRELRGRLPRTDTARPDFKVVGHGGTDVGRRREANEDSFLLMPKNALFIVADGMGGHAGGQVASKLTVQGSAEAIVRRLAEQEAAAARGGPPVNVPGLLDAAVREACARVFDTAHANPALLNMGSTVTLMLVYGSVAYFAHVGDSRAYLVREGRIFQVTEDHSLVQEQVSQGLMTPEQAKVSMIRNIITRSIGYERDVMVDTGAVPLRKGDTFVLCSDGLTGHVDDPEILDVVQKQPLGAVPRTLIALANSRGGDDNSTVVVVNVVGGRGPQRDKRAGGRA